jgi:hypothetical protein
MHVKRQDVRVIGISGGWEIGLDRLARRKLTLALAAARHTF